MSIFSRFKDIISSNINSMLDDAEDPEKLIRLMLREMEETLVELKSGCAATMAKASKAAQAEREAEEEVVQWDKRAELALRAKREDMAREALAEKLQAQERLAQLAKNREEYERLVDKCRDDIRTLEERIAHTRDRRRLLVERHNQARMRHQAHRTINAADNSDAMRRFNDLEQRINRMENEAELSAPRPAPHSAFRDMERDAAIEDELAALRRRMGE